MSDVKKKIAIVLGALAVLAPLFLGDVPVYASAGAAIAAIIAAFYHPAPPKE